jgi:large subunit ribosomal protein L6
MSRIGKKPIGIPQGVKANIADGSVNIEGPKGKLNFHLPPSIHFEVKDNKILLTTKSSEKEDSMKHGLSRAIINNMIKGVSDGYTRDLEIVGVGFKGQVTGKKLVLNLGFSHPVEYDVPEGITVETPKPNQIIVKGIDKQKVGLVAAQIRDFYKPEPYKGKGIRYVGEYVRKKAGKTVA